jgi:hypothetical protein
MPVRVKAIASSREDSFGLGSQCPVDPCLQVHMKGGLFQHHIGDRVLP